MTAHEASRAALDGGERPLVSLLLPTFNREAYLNRFFGHHLQMLQHAGVGFEIVVSDNASTDGTEEVVRYWFGKSDAIRYVRQPDNIGGYGNFVQVFRKARGKYAVWVGDDDLLVPDAFFKMIALMERKPDIHVVQAPWLVINEYDPDHLLPFYVLDEPRILARGDYRGCVELLLKHHIFPEWFVIRTDMIPEIIGPPDPHVYHYFGHLNRALRVGAVAFLHEPFALVTGVSKLDLNSWRPIFRSGPLISLAFLPLWDRSRLNPGATSVLE